MSNTAAYSSHEFTITGMHESPPYGMFKPTAVLNDTIFVFYVNNLVIRYATLEMVPTGQNAPRPISIEAGDAANPMNWKTNTIDLQNYGQPKTHAGFSVVVTATTLYLFWQDGHQVNMARLSVETHQWDGPYIMVPKDVLPYPKQDIMRPWHSQDCVAATAIGDEVIALALDAMNLGPRQEGIDGYLGIFHIDDIDPNAKTWPSRQEINFYPTIVRSGTSLALTWFNGPTDPETKAPQVVLWLTGPSVGKKQGSGADDPYWHSNFYALAGGTGLEGITPIDGWYGYRVQPGDVMATGLTRDPAGRLIALASTSHGSSSGFERYVIPTGRALPSSGATPITVSEQTHIDFDKAHFGANVLYYTDMNNGTPIAYSGNATDTPDGTSYPVYEFAFAGTGGAVCCRIARYGSAETFPDRASFTPEPKRQGTVILRGIVDGPMPIPDINLAHVEAESLPETFGTMTYGVGLTKGAEREVSNSWTVGFKSEGEAEKGFGPAWDISIKGGCGFIRSSGETITTRKDINVPTIIDPNARKAGTPKVLGVGHVITSDLKLQATIFRFRDAQGNLVVDTSKGFDQSQATLFTTVRTEFDEDPGSDTFDCFSVKSGDVTSFTREAIDAHMKAAGLYDGDHYVAEVIEANAAQVGTENNEIFLAYSWDNSTTTNSAQFQSIRTSFKEDSWSLDGEVYAGISGGAGASVFGMGEEETFKFMVGASYSHEEKKATNEEHELSVGLEKGIELPSAALKDVDKGVINLRFRLYFLPPPGKDNPGKLPTSYWARELQAALRKTSQGKNRLDPDLIDENSSPWRVFYMVTHYELQDGTVYPWT